MEDKNNDVKKRTVVIAVDGSEHSNRAFDCEYFTFRCSIHLCHHLGIPKVSGQFAPENSPPISGQFAPYIYCTNLASLNSLNIANCL